MKFFEDHILKDKEIELILSRTTTEDKKTKWVPSYEFYICLHNGTVVGTCDLRIGHNENIYYSGNIGYEIYEEFRGNRYASKAVRLLYELAKLHNVESLLITCDPSNGASKRVCERAGAKFIERATIPERHQMYQEGKREVLVFEYILK